jgi:hypothetical protein
MMSCLLYEGEKFCIPCISPDVAVVDGGRTNSWRRGKLWGKAMSLSIGKFPRKILRESDSG